MPSKRSSSLQSPNPIKHQVCDLFTSAESSPVRNDVPKIPSPFVAEGCAVSALPPHSSVQDPTSVQDLTFPISPQADVLPPASMSSPQTSAVELAPASPLSPQASAAGQLQVSPGNNRALFMSKHTQSRIMCNMDLCRSAPGSKVALSAVVIAVFDANSNPDRRYIQLADATGSVGITVWNANVGRFSRQSVGKVVKCGKLVVGSHQGKKVLTMTRESTLEFEDEHPLRDWWCELARLQPVRLSSICDIADNSIINVAAIVGMIVAEHKMVGTVQKTLTTLHLADPTGQFDVKTWNHSPDDFLVFSEKPVLFRRIRVTSFSGTKMGELLDNGGSIIESEFAGKEALRKYWAE